MEASGVSGNEEEMAEEAEGEELDLTSPRNIWVLLGRDLDCLEWGNMVVGMVMVRGVVLLRVIKGW